MPWYYAVFEFARIESSESYDVPAGFGLLLLLSLLRVAIATMYRQVFGLLLLFPRTPFSGV